MNFKLHAESKTLDEYYKMQSSIDVVDKIKVPAFFYFALDDPVIRTSSTLFEKLRNNENIALATTDCGSHLCGMTSSLNSNQFYLDLAMEWFGQLEKT